MAEWEKCYSKTLKFEGGFQKIFNDRGNWTGGSIGKGDLKGTKYGISAKSYPHLDIESLTKDDAIEIFRRDYWNKLRLTDIDSNRVAWKAFDIAINCGCGTAAKILQRSVDVVDDGIVGNITLEAVNKSDNTRLLREMVRRQQEHYLNIHDDENDWAFKGWMIRAEDTAPELEKL
ncbi:MAG: secretion activator protein [Thermoplasmata archaeon]|nr:secretion activator protein [Thermoplasmata archaeon]